jgi:tetratricopeptide (TPR) repeat protein
LRLDIMVGRVIEALPQVEVRLAQLKVWWQQHRSGKPALEAPSLEFLARAFISGLDIAREADIARQDWNAALDRGDAILEIKRVLERPTEDIARDRLNRANVLWKLGRFDEARAEIETCLMFFQNDPAAMGTTLTSLAGLLGDQGDTLQAIMQERRALALKEQLADPRNRAISHHNLAVYLVRAGTSAHFAESDLHRLSALIYRLASGLDLQSSLSSYAFHFRRAQAAGTALTVPRISDLLADPAFHPLDTWLRKLEVDVAELQTAVDQLLEEARQAAIAPQGAPPAP